jgi:hypothetical protein
MTTLLAMTDNSSTSLRRQSDYPSLHLYAFVTLAIPAVSAECERFAPNRLQNTQNSHQAIKPSG